MSEQRVVRGYRITEDRDASRGSVFAGKWEDAACQMMFPDYDPKREIVTILTHHNQGVGPLEGWMVEWLLKNEAALPQVPDRIRFFSTPANPDKRYERTWVQIDELIATAIAEILGEDQ